MRWKMERSRDSAWRTERPCHRDSKKNETRKGPNDGIDNYGPNLKP